jgi:hypothetical protein
MAKNLAYNPHYHGGVADGWPAAPTDCIITDEDAPGVSWPAVLIDRCAKVVFVYVANNREWTEGTTGKMTVTPNTQYTFSAYVYIPSLSAGGAIRLREYEYQGATFKTNVDATDFIATNAGFVRKSKTFTTGATTDGIRFCYKVLAASSTSYITGWMLEQSGSVSTYNEGTVLYPLNLLHTKIFAKGVMGPWPI